MACLLVLPGLASTALVAAQVRFLFPVLPVFNLGAACALSRIWQRRGKRFAGASGAAAAVAALVACAAIAAAFTAASRHNYPGQPLLASAPL